MVENNYYNVPNPSYGGVPYRSVATCIILSLITCGIYGIYWFVVMTDDTNRVSGNMGATSGGVAFLLNMITCGIYGLYWMYKRGEYLDQAKTSRGIPSSNGGVLYLILSLVGFSIISYALIQSELNKFSGRNMA